MSTSRAALSALLVLALPSVALAADPIAVNHRGQPLTLSAGLPAATLGVPVSRPALAGTVLYSNLGSELELFDTSSSWLVASKVAAGDYQAVAMPFTVALPTRLQQARIAVNWIFGTRAMKVGLYADDAGLPGAKIKQLLVTNLPDIGSCCATVDTGFGRPALEGGKTYWIVARVPKSSDTSGGWSFNNTGDVGTFASNQGSGWHQGYYTRGAFEVIGR